MIIPGDFKWFSRLLTAWCVQEFLEMSGRVSCWTLGGYFVGVGGLSGKTNRDAPCEKKNLKGEHEIAELSGSLPVTLWRSRFSDSLLSFVWMTWRGGVGCTWYCWWNSCSHKSWLHFQLFSDVFWYDCSASCSYQPSIINIFLFN